MRTDDPDLLKAITTVRTAIERARADGVDIPQPVLEARMRELTGGKYGYDAEMAQRIAHRPFGMRDAARGVTQGLMAGWADEAGLVDPAADRAQMEANPGSSMAARAVGAMLPAIATAGVVNPATSALARTGVGILTGVVSGAAAGAGEAEPGERMEGAALGGVTGGLGAGLLGGGLELGNALRPSVRGARRLRSAVERSTPDLRPDLELGRSTIRQTALRGEATGKPRILADMSPALMLEGEFAAQHSAEVFAPIEKLLWGRQLNMSRRIIDDLDVALPFGTENVSKVLQGMRTSRRAFASSPAGYAGLREANPQIPTGDFARAMQVPETLNAWRQARLGGDMTEASLPASVRQAFLVPRTVMGGGGAKAPMFRQTSFRDLHAFRQMMDDKAAAAFDSRKGNLGEAYARLRDETDAVIRAAVPDYARVQTEYARMMASERALVSGAKAWRSTADDLRSVVDAIPDEHLDTFRRGMAGAIVSQLRNAKTNRRAATDLINRSISEDEKLELVFGDQATFQTFVRAMLDEQEMAKGLNTMVGNSRTALRQGMEEVNPVEVMAIAGSVPSAAIPAAVGARLAPRAVNQMTARLMGKPLMTRGTTAIDEAVDEILRKAGAPLGRGRTALDVYAGTGMAGLLGGPRN